VELNLLSIALRESHGRAIVREREIKDQRSRLITTVVCFHDGIRAGMEPDVHGEAREEATSLGR